MNQLHRLEIKLNKNKQSKFFAVIFATVYIVIQRLTNWPIIDFIDVRNYRNSSDFYTIMELKQYSWSEWLKIKPLSIHYGDSVYFLARIVENLNIPLEPCIVFFQFSFCYLVLRMLMKTRLSWSSIVIFLLTFPPISFALQRMNFDLIFFIFIYIAFLKFIHPILSASFLASISSIKFYPIPLFLLLTYNEKRKYAKVILILVFGCISVLVFDDVLNSNPPIQGSVQFGLPVVGYYFAVILDRTTDFSYWYHPALWHVLGLVVFLMMLGLILLFQRKCKSKILQNEILNPLNSIRLYSLQEKAFLATLSLCFLSGLNFDYRLIFSIPIITHYLNSSKVQSDLPFSFWMLIMAGYLSGAIWVPLQLVGDICSFLFFSVLICANIPRPIWAKVKDQK